MSDDLWGEFCDDSMPEENRIISIIREQSSYLDKKTNGAIKALFKKVEYMEVPPSMLDVVGEFAKSVGSLRSATSMPIDELEGKVDINERYLKSKYRFEIYNETFRYKVFTINYSVEFPNEIILEEGIREELSAPTKIEINSNDEFVSWLGKILTSKKVRLVIARMLQEQKKRISAEDYISEHEEFTARELAEALGVTLEQAKKSLVALEKQGSVMKIKEGKSISWKRIDTK